MKDEEIGSSFITICIDPGFYVREKSTRCNLVIFRGFAEENYQVTTCTFLTYTRIRGMITNLQRKVRPKMVSTEDENCIFKENTVRIRGAHHFWSTFRGKFVIIQRMRVRNQGQCICFAPASNVVILCIVPWYFFVLFLIKVKVYIYLDFTEVVFEVSYFYLGFSYCNRIIINKKSNFILLQLDILFLSFDFWVHHNLAPISTFSHAFQF